MDLADCFLFLSLVNFLDIRRWWNEFCLLALLETVRSFYQCMNLMEESTWSQCRVVWKSYSFSLLSSRKKRNEEREREKKRRVDFSFCLWAITQSIVRIVVVDMTTFLRILLVLLLCLLLTEAIGEKDLVHRLAIIRWLLFKQNLIELSDHHPQFSLCVCFFPLVHNEE